MLIAIEAITQLLLEMPGEVVALCFTTDQLVDGRVG
jgi:hypothetical protein